MSRWQVADPPEAVAPTLALPGAFRASVIVRMLVLCGLCTIMGLHAMTAAARSRARPRCPAVPAFLTLRMTRDRFEAPGGGRVDPQCSGEDMDGTCPGVPDSSWKREVGKFRDVFVRADGPTGSGRYWCVTVGVGSSGEQRPSHGCCLLTSTLGWRTLQEYSGGALPWASDVDVDGAPEILIWDSFPLYPEASNAEYGLIVWVYRVASETVATIDWDLSRQWALRLVAEYRRPLGPGERHWQPIRSQVAAALETFAHDRCAVDTSVVR
jgi:hypothetical protein